MNDVLSAPCKGCTERCIEPNCHNDCQRYLAWKKKYQDAQNSRKAYRKAQNDVYFLTKSWK